MKESDLNLHALVKNRRWDDVKSHPAQSLTLDFFSRTPLHWACTLKPPVDVVTHLLHRKNNTDVRLPDSSGGYTPLHLASLHDASFDVISFLLSRCPRAASVVDKLGWTPLHHASFNCSSVEVIESLVSAYPRACEIMTSNGSTCLHLACRKGVSVEVVNIILKANPSTVTVTMRHGWTPLHLCIWNGASYDVLKAILEVDSTTVTIRNKMGMTPLSSLWKEYYTDEATNEDDLMAAMERRDTEWRKKLSILLYASYFGTLANYEYGKSWNIVHAVLSCPDELPGLLSTVLRLQPESVKCPDKDGWLPLHLACVSPKIQTEDLDDVLAAFPAAAAILGPNGRYPLMLAIENGKRWNNGLNNLFYAFPDAVERRDRDKGMYPFMTAAVGEKPSLTTIYELLLCCPQLVRS